VAHKVIASTDPNKSFISVDPQFLLSQRDASFEVPLPMQFRWPPGISVALRMSAEARSAAATDIIPGACQWNPGGRLKVNKLLLTNVEHTVMVRCFRDAMMTMQTTPPPNPIVAAGTVRFGNRLPLAVIAGPCVLESRRHALDMAGTLKEIAARLGIGLVYKTSFDKANRTSATSARGLGLDGALAVFEEIRTRLAMPVLTDVHESGQCAEVAGVVDVLQIPAFLCRQTDLLVAAARTGRTVNVKKGQFLAPWDMTNVVAKITSAGNSNVMVTERGASFGYSTLVSDMRALPILARTGAPVIFDATHSVQQPGGRGASSGGEREFVPVLARAAVAVGVAGVFIETHQDPDRAPSDGPNMVPLKDMEGLLRRLMAFDHLAKNNAP
jgi:2-dehydro-3-deoxyphosphooctonate aldolase (KDO 8-P synthase)